MLEKIFKLKENHTNVKKEVLAGFTTFMTMAYILAVNPTTMTAFNEKGYAGTLMNPNGVFFGTAIAAAIGCFLMAFLANYPFGLAPGMGLNAYFCYTVVLSLGYTWEEALAAVFVEGIIFVLLSLTNIREAIFNAIPKTLKHAVSCGIGLFIAFIGLQNAGIVQDNPNTLLQFHKFSGKAFDSSDFCALLALIGILIMAILLIKKVKGGILLGILITWVLGCLGQAAGLYKVNVEQHFYSMLPNFSNPAKISSLGDVAFKLDFSRLLSGGFIMAVFAFLFVDMFDTLGTLIGVSSKADMLDKDGKLPRIKGALLADSIATIIGSVFGVSTTTTYVESATGVSEGGRTGLTAVTTGILFALSMLLAPIFTAIPSCATAPALIIVGFYMMASVLSIDLNDMLEGIPAFICILAMTFFYSIAEGISLGVISYVLLNLFTRNAKKKNISWLMYVLAVLFVCKYIFIK
ncbi:NCS2 family permease [[Clostridium] polysaccharolyticum]|uniref:Putative MFS transporter, AGZA family, xanthine/uracil permease n=1 Tax=[Clostridium] polysaccharolyticum TaxID=29364 RepID=A0A1H9ZDV1_9FIRM|nr:NCS2 family permease [[Clostridium] polysaccharolyticum]SES79760.1 putative MFS transporter, AGZA family, xanthine/uracil permease [[Clostridium] polysaccharolyticum]